jgi:hypothetical protein
VDDAGETQCRRRERKEGRKENECLELSLYGFPLCFVTKKTWTILTSYRCALTAYRNTLLLAANGEGGAERTEREESSEDNVQPIVILIKNNSFSPYFLCGAAKYVTDPSSFLSLS